MSAHTDRTRRVKAALCYKTREWNIVRLGPEAVPGWKCAVDRVRTLPHDAAGFPLEHWLASAYLQGVMDGQQVASEIARRGARDAAGE